MPTGIAASCGIVILPRRILVKAFITGISGRDGSYLSEHLGWKPKYSFEMIWKEMVNECLNETNKK